MQPTVAHSEIFVIDEATTTEPAGVSGIDFQNIALYVQGSDDADFSIRIKGSIQREVPDFTAPSEIDNQWTYMQLKNDMTSSYLDGDVGYVFGNDGVVTVEINTSVLSWVAIEIFNYSSGTAQCQFTFKNNI